MSVPLSARSLFVIGHRRCGNMNSLDVLREVKHGMNSYSSKIWKGRNSVMSNISNGVTKIFLSCKWSLNRGSAVYIISHHYCERCGKRQRRHQLSPKMTTRKQQVCSSCWDVSIRSIRHYPKALFVRSRHTRGISGCQI